MRSPLTLENCLILACARTDPDGQRIEDLVQRGPDWQAILRRVERWGLAPLVYTNLRQVIQSGRVPKPVAEHLRHLYHRDTIHGVARRELLRAALLRFSEARIPVIVLKGAALATLVYPSPGLRTTGNIDLLIHKRDLDRVDTLLSDMREATALRAGTVAGPDARKTIPYLGREVSSLLDVRHDLLDPQSGAAPRIPINEFWERARPAQIESVATLVLNHEDLLLHLALHLAYERGFVGQAKILCDIRETCRRYADAINWSYVIGRVRAYDVEKVVYHCLRLAHELVDASVPFQILTELRASFGQLPLEQQLIAAVARRAVLSEPSRFYKVGMDLLATRQKRDGFITVCRYLGRLRRSRATGSGPPDMSIAEGPSDALSSGASPREESMHRPPVQGSCPAEAVGEIAVTYDNQTTTDGVGSQLLRIYGLYAVSRALHTKYVHTPLARVDYQGFVPLLTGRADPDFVARYNAFFSLPADEFDLESCERARIHILSGDTVERYREHAAATGRPVLLEVIHPYGYTDAHPTAFHALRAVSPYRAHRPAGPIRVCIHLRRGDISVPGRTDGQARVLPDSYYLRVCNTVLHALRQHDAPFVVRLHTEVPTRRCTLYPETRGLFFWLYHPVTVDPSQYSLEEFAALPDLETVLNVEAREALDDFATADVLILSLSSLGYLGGLLNPHGLVIYAPWWHPALPEWLVADEHGNLDQTQVATRIAIQLRRRGLCETASLARGCA
jgi:hypothetical protein